MAVKKRNIQEKIPIPSGLSDAQKQELSKRIVEEVRNRTNRSINKHGKNFPSYSKEYKSSLDFKNAGKSSKVNLQLSGDMLAELDVLDISSLSITIGYETSHEDAGKVEGNTIGSFGEKIGNPAKARDFIGLPNKVVKLLVEEIKADPEFKEERERSSSIVSAILSRFK